jgi:hypothetical protein
MGNQDDHYHAWGTLTEVRTGVIAPALTKEQSARIRPAPAAV